MANNNFGKITIKNAISGNVYSGTRSVKEVFSDTTAGWNAKPDHIAKKDTIYVYTDYKVVDNESIPNIKIGDGSSYLIDMPFLSDSGVTPEQIEFWNSKVSCFIDSEDEENLIFYTGLVP